MNGRTFVRMLLLPTALGTLLAAGGCENPQRPPFIFEIPAGYKGWVSVEFFRPDCPQMATEGEKIVVKIPAGGQLCTGAPMGFGNVQDEFYYVDAAGKRTDARADVRQEHVVIEGAAPRQIYERFFVGTEAELKVAPKPRFE